MIYQSNIFGPVPVLGEAQNRKGIGIDMKRYIKFFNTYRMELCIIGLLTVLNLIFGVVFPYVNGMFVDNLVITNSYRNTVFWAVVICFVGLSNSIVEYNLKCKSKMVNEHIYFDVRKEITDHFRRVSILKYRENNASYLNKRIELDITRIISFILDNFILIFAQLIQVTTIFTIICLINWQVFVCICVILPVYYWVYTYLKKPIFEHSLLAREKTAGLFQTMNEQLEYMEDIVIESNYSVHDSLLKKMFAKYYDSVIRYTKTIARFSFAQSIFAVLFQVTVFLLGGYFVIKEQMTIGQLTMITTYFSLIMNCMSYYIELAKNYQITKSSIFDMEKLYGIEENVEGTKIISGIHNIDANLKFAYSEKAPTVLDICIHASKGECIGVLGVNGAGKTTLTKLLIGSLKGESYDKCDIKYNNQYELSELDSVILRNKNISYIPQKIRYINITISEIFNEVGNFKRPESILEKLEEINIDISYETSRFLHEVWEKKIDDLSGGDKQFIIIIKSLLKGSSMIIFDEPSSNLDKNRIQWLKNTIIKIKETKIVFVISHDKNLFDLFDRTVQLG